MGSKARAVSTGALLMLAMMLLLLPLRWICAALVAALIHELGHYGAVMLCKGHVSRMRVGAIHSAMEVTGLTDWQEILCILAGPLAGLLTLLLVRQLPLIAICGFAQTLYNLLPVYPLDGGRLLRCLSRIFHFSDRQLSATETVFLLVLVALVLAAGYRLGLSVFVGGCLILARAISGKIPCKHRRDWI